MNSGITLITPTGGRLESFANCATYVQRFIKPARIPIQWLIVDDYADAGKSLYVTGIHCQHIIPSHQWSPGKNTLALNLLAAIPHVEHDYVLFIEDDDYYAPEYLESMYEGLQEADIVGEVPARYYHVPSRQYNVQGNRQHASLCQTGIRGCALPALEAICNDTRPEFIDVRLWRMMGILHTNVSEEYVFRKKFLETAYCVGMKGLPGRAGIGIGHRPEQSPQMWTKDFDLTVLKRWIGGDVQLYTNVNAFTAPTTHC